MLNQGMGVQIMLFDSKTRDEIKTNSWYSPEVLIPNIGDWVTIEQITYYVRNRMIIFFQGGMNTQQGVSLYVDVLANTRTEGDRFVKDTRLPRPDNSN